MDIPSLVPVKANQLKGGEYYLFKLKGAKRTWNCGWAKKHLVPPEKSTDSTIMLKWSFIVGLGVVRYLATDCSDIYLIEGLE